MCATKVSELTSRASRAVPDTVTRAGGTPHINRVGHAFFKTRMRAEGSLFGGEVSGHYYFRDFFCADSGTIPALLVLELLSRTGKRMSELLEPYRSRYFISGEINSEVSDPTAKMQELAARYDDGAYSGGTMERPALQRLLEERFHEAMQDGLEIGEAHGLVDKQSLHLVKHGRMTDVGIHAIHTSRGDQRNRRLL